MNTNQIETPNHRRTGMLPVLAAVATLAPAMAGLALAGRADAARPAVNFHCSNEHGNGTSANPLDDNTDHGLDAGATGANTVSSACGATTTVATTTAPTTVVVATLPAPVTTIVTTSPVTTSPATTAPATTAPATTAPAVTPTVATLPEIVPLLTPSTSTADPTTTVAVTLAPATTAPPTTAVPPTTAPVTTVRPTIATTIPVEIAPNDGAVVNPAVGLAFTVGRPATDGTGPTAPGTGGPTAGVAPSDPTASNAAISNPGRSTVGTYGSETMGLTPPPVEVLGISISRFAEAATAPSGVADMLAFTGASSGHLTSLAGAAISLGLGLVNLARRNRRIRRA